MTKKDEMLSIHKKDKLFFFENELYERSDEDVKRSIYLRLKREEEKMMQKLKHWTKENSWWIAIAIAILGLLFPGAFAAAGNFLIKLFVAMLPFLQQYWIQSLLSVAYIRLWLRLRKLEGKDKEKDARNEHHKDL